ncbi:GNAT family N-acetyltransferase [Patulibacter defluvii]|uniref:GNAT family N-acetyltransferase n=1 Tax=Patulibacter defluvii TaxID=3095358 RepID=UPI002A766889|nr:GNAT family N-acetyltransferase [Patulibacter sp. DM4]
MLLPLHDGTTVLLRRIVPEDGPLLRRAHRMLSEETVRNRFLSAKPALTSRDVRYLTDVDFVDHVAVVAVDPQRPEAILGVARWIRDPADRSQAEAAFVVADALQGQGLGSALAIALADLAVERGIDALRGSMLAGNRGSEALFRTIGAGELTVARMGITNEVVAPLPAHDDRLERLASRRRLAARRRGHAGGRPAVRRAA